jgi:YHS domain-containing protein
MHEGPHHGKPLSCHLAQEWGGRARASRGGRHDLPSAAAERGRQCRFGVFPKGRVMSALPDFRQQLAGRVTASEKAPRWPSSDVEKYMAAFDPRRQHFDATATALITTVVKPRLDALAAQFPSARTMTDEQGRWYACWLASSDRFPVTAKVEFVVEHDPSVAHLYVRYEAYLMPVFFQFQPHDKLTMPLDQVDQNRVVQWVEERIFEFLETYLRHDRGTDDLEDTVTDPVCGMRLRRSDAREQADYRGHAYFFCSQECREKFERRPGSFVTFRTM